MIGELSFLGPHYFAPHYFGRRYFRLPVPIDDRSKVHVAPVLRIAKAVALSRGNVGAQSNRGVAVIAQMRIVAAPAVSRSVVAQDSGRQVEVD